MAQDMHLRRLVMCTGERLTSDHEWNRVPSALAALEYIHSLIGAREEKRGKRRETFS